MLRPRNLILLVLVCLGAAMFTSPAFASRPSGLVNTIGSTHFLVHFQSDPSTTYAITQTNAADIAALAEHAYTAEIGDGYTAPPSDGVLGGDGRIDIYIVDLTTDGTLGEAVSDTGAITSTGSILLDGANSGDGLNQHTIAHELFHIFQFGLWNSPNLSDYWLYEGSAEWMGYRVDGYGGEFELGPDDMSLDCRDPNGLGSCNLSGVYENNGYSRWPFFEYLGERFGYSFMQSIFAQGGSGAATATAALANAIAAKGTTLADVYNAWSTVEMTGGYTVAQLKTETPTPYAAIPTGMTSGTLPSESVAVNHLATRYIEFLRGSGDDSAPCFAATLTVTVTMPAGTLSQPTFYWNGTGSNPVPLSINGNVATLTVPWDTCTYVLNEAFLSLPNASQNVDAAIFNVTSSLSVDTTHPANAGAPPPPITTWGTVYPVSSVAAAPSIVVYGPELLTLSATDKQIRLIVESNGEGTLQASLGGTALGSGALRPGNNDLRFTLPAGVLSAIRRSAAADVLTLTPASTDGTSKGPAVTRQVAIAPATTVQKTASAKAKAEAKAKAKAKAKAAAKAKAKAKAKSHK
ncbi:MAG TPA: hypothetical protein VII51_01510 [Gaiellaceae bacterium]